MNARSRSLLTLLEKEAGSRVRASSMLLRASQELGLEESHALDATVLTLALSRLKVEIDEVARLLTWQDFEQFAAGLLRMGGYEVEENVLLRKPRAQIDLVARSPSVFLTIDCKHWSRLHPFSSVMKFAEAQMRRSRLFRRSLGNDRRPIFSAILTLSEQRERFVDGVAIVPLHTLRDFLDSLGTFGDLRTV